VSPIELGELFLFGIVIGCYGTIVGAGGGFVVVPFLLLVYHTTPQQTVGTSFGMVFLNALSGTIAYIRAKRVDYRSGWKFALATLPGTAAGVYLSEYFSTRTFHVSFGVLLCMVAVYLVLRPDPRKPPAHPVEAKPPRAGWVEHTLVDAFGERYTYRFNERGGIAVSVLVGFFASIFGLGGGIMHVPLLIYVFGFPAHIATATSHFILAITTAIGSGFHLALGNVLLPISLSLGLGAMIGAQIGGAISHRIKGAWLLRLLSIALFVVGGRLIYGAFTG
jgi:uncharacterized membrane protein YfcA